MQLTSQEFTTDLGLWVTVEKIHGKTEILVQNKQGKILFSGDSETSLKVMSAITEAQHKLNRDEFLRAESEANMTRVPVEVL